MKEMRRFLTHLLILLMLMPGLACGSFMNSSKAQAAQPMHAMESCHGMGMDKSQKAPHDGSRTFFKDCMQNDLAGVDHLTLKAPNNGGKISFMQGIEAIPVKNLALASAQSIRGPPPERPCYSENQPSILLITQRLRI